MNSVFRPCRPYRHEDDSERAEIIAREDCGVMAGEDGSTKVQG